MDHLTTDEWRDALWVSGVSARLAPYCDASPSGSVLSGDLCNKQDIQVNTHPDDRTELPFCFYSQILSGCNIHRSVSANQTPRNSFTDAAAELDEKDYSRYVGRITTHSRHEKYRKKTFSEIQNNEEFIENICATSLVDVFDSATALRAKEVAEDLGAMIAEVRKRNEASEELRRQLLRSNFLRSTMSQQ